MKLVQITEECKREQRGCKGLMLLEADNFEEAGLFSNQKYSMFVLWALIETTPPEEVLSWLRRKAEIK